jgi:hypothetical protein
MKFTLLAAAALATLVATPAFAQAKKDNTQVAVVSTPGQVSATRARSVTATVTEVDSVLGRVTLKAPNGDLYPLKVGPEVRNLPQVKVGDNVVARYQENLTLTLMKDGKGKVGATEMSKAARADAGQKPGAVVAEQTEVIADVTAVNASKKTITLKGAKQTLDLSVQDPEQLKLIKVGDQVKAVYTQALVVGVEAAAAKK